MKITRRQFIKGAAATGIGLALPLKFGVREARAFYQSSPVQLWKTAFRNAGDIAVALWDGYPSVNPAPTTGVKHYTINIGQFQDQLLPVPATGQNLTTLWGFQPANALGTNPTHLGGIIIAKKGEPVQITFKNMLPQSNQSWGRIHIIPVDTSIPGANQAQNRTAIHIHGGFVPWISDGGPFDWFAPDGTKGESFLNNDVLNPGVPNSQAEYYYPNDQSARLVWYHDHAWGITRINAYAGIATAYIIRDDFEAGLVGNWYTWTPGTYTGSGLPPYIEDTVLNHPGTEIQELPIVVQDKIFVNGDPASPNYIGTIDPDWVNKGLGPKSTGSLWYAHTYDPLRWTLQKGFAAPTDPSVVAEFFGDTMLCNGTVYPEVSVEPRRYRLRVLNACNARFLNLQLYVDNGTANGITLDPKTGIPLNAPFRNVAAPNPQLKPTSNFLVIGSEGGFLPSAVYVPSNIPFNAAALTGSLILGPAERSDVIVDFSQHAGKNLILYTDAPAPYPVGDPRNDYFPGWNIKGNPVNGTTPAGSGPNTRIIVRFKVGTTVTLPADPPLNIKKGTSFSAGIDQLLVTPGVTTLPAGVPVRSLTLNETFDNFGRLIQLEGTNMRLANAPGFGRAYLDPTTEFMNSNATEVWQIANLTGDTHPIHFHLVNVQIISRQAFSVTSYKGVPNVMGAPLPPNPEEMGWKETVRMNPGEVTTVIMQFKLPTVPFNVPASPRNAANATDPLFGGGVPLAGIANEYVWHCHILEHEEHDMMRPLVVLGQTPWVQTVSGSTGGIVTFRINYGTAPYNIVASDQLFPPIPTPVATKGGTFTVTVPASTLAQTVTYTITDSTPASAGGPVTVIATLNIT